MAWCVLGSGEKEIISFYELKSLVGAFEFGAERGEFVV
jgi:hypothetical protein